METTASMDAGIGGIFKAYQLTSADFRVAFASGIQSRIAKVRATAGDNA